MPGATLDGGLRDLVEQENHLDVRKVFKAGEGVRAEDIAVQFDGRAARAPVVIDGLRAPAAYVADGLNLK